MCWRVIPVALVSLAVGAPASAQFQALGPGDYRCSAPAGQYFNRAIPPLEIGKPVTVRFRFIADHPDLKWPQQAAIQFITPSGRMTVMVGKTEDDPDHVYVELVNGKSGYFELISQYHVTNSWIEVGLTLTNRGIVLVKSGGVNELNLKTKLPVKTELHCHSGEFEIQVVRP